jgi:hypothetical protein
MYPVATREQALRLLAAGWSLSAISDELGVSRWAVRSWRDHGVVSEHQRRCTCPVCNAQVALDTRSYALLLGYYLGDGCVSRTRRTFSLRVSCDERYPGIIADVGSAISRVHPAGAVCHVKGPGVTVVQNCWNHWPCLFPQHGPGRKHERELSLEGWQREAVQAYPALFLRGLLHSDGCRTKNWATRTVGGVTKRYDYARWEFVNHSDDIRRWCAETLDLVEVPWRLSSWRCISVSTRAGVARLDALIGLKH